MDDSRGLIRATVYSVSHKVTHNNLTYLKGYSLLPMLATGSCAGGSIFWNTKKTIAAIIAKITSFAHKERPPFCFVSCDGGGACDTRLLGSKLDVSP